ncbi:MAG: hypothetical protein ACPGQL_07095 [Thermoplasmatota archaeon]
MEDLGPRNDALVDGWSLIHFATGIGMALLMDPFIALVLMILWEPLEIAILSPILAKRGIDFGRETWRNSVSDIIVDAAGVAAGHYLLLPLWNPLGI